MSLSYITNEFGHIRPFINSSPTRPQRSSEKGPTGLVEVTYKSNENREAIKEHYKSELSSHGWKFCKVEKFTYSGQGYEGEHVFYRKDIYTANLQFAGRQETEFGWTYVFGISWGIFDDLKCPD